MSAVLVDIRSPWEQASDAALRSSDLIAEIPGGFPGFDLDAKSVVELREAAALMQRANYLMRRILEREEPRVDAMQADCDARGVAAPWG